MNVHAGWTPSVRCCTVRAVKHAESRSSACMHTNSSASVTCSWLHRGKRLVERVREARICAVQAFYRYLDRTIPGVRRRIRQFRPLARVRNWYGPGPFCGALKLRSCPSTSQFPWIQRGSWATYCPPPCYWYAGPVAPSSSTPTVSTPCRLAQSTQSQVPFSSCPSSQVLSYDHPHFS